MRGMRFTVKRGGSEVMREEGLESEKGPSPPKDQGNEALPPRTRGMRANLEAVEHPDAGHWWEGRQSRGRPAKIFSPVGTTHCSIPLSVTHLALSAAPMCRCAASPRARPDSQKGLISTLTLFILSRTLHALPSARLFELPSPGMVPPIHRADQQHFPTRPRRRTQFLTSLPSLLLPTLLRLNINLILQGDTMTVSAAIITSDTTPINIPLRPRVRSVDSLTSIANDPSSSSHISDKPVEEVFFRHGRVEDAPLMTEMQFSNYLFHYPGIAPQVFLDTLNYSAMTAYHVKRMTRTSISSLLMRERE